MVSLVKEVHQFIEAIEKKIIPHLSEITVIIYSIQSHFTKTANLHEFKVDPSEQSIPAIKYMNPRGVENLSEFNSLQKFLEENVFLMGIPDKGLQIIDVHNLLLRLVPTILQYYEWRYVYPSNKKFDKMYLANFISAFLIFYSIILFKQHLPTFYFIKKLATYRLEKIMSNNANSISQTNSIRELKHTIELWDNILKKIDTLNKLANEINACDYERNFFLSGLTVEGTFRVLGDTYFLNPIKNFNFENLKLIEYPRPVLYREISPAGSTESLVFKRDIKNIIINWEGIRGIFLNKSSAYLQYKGKIEPFQIIEVENNLYKVIQLLKLYRFSTILLTNRLVFPPFLEALVNELLFYIPHSETSNYLIQMPVTRPIKTKDGTPLREFVQRNLKSIPSPYFNKGDSLSVAIERYNRAIFLPFSLERNFSILSLSSESIFHIVCGLDSLYKLGWITKKSKKARNVKKEREEKVKLVAKLLAKVSLYQEEKIWNDISKAYNDYRNQFAHGQENRTEESYLREQLSLVIRLIDYLRLSILIRLHFDSERDWANFMQKIFNEKIIPHVSIHSIHIEKDIDQKVLDALFKSIQLFLSKYTPNRYHEFEASLFRNKEFVKNYEKVLATLADLLKKEKPHFFKEKSDRS